jgi:hypothetical protein
MRYASCSCRWCIECDLKQLALQSSSLPAIFVQHFDSRNGSACRSLLGLGSPKPLLPLGSCRGVALLCRLRPQHQQSCLYSMSTSRRAAGGGRRLQPVAAHSKMRSNEPDAAAPATGCQWTPCLWPRGPAHCAPPPAGEGQYHVTPGSRLARPTVQACSACCIRTRQSPAARHRAQRAPCLRHRSHRSPQEMSTRLGALQHVVVEWQITADCQLGAASMRAGDTSGMSELQIEGGTCSPG